MTADPAPYLVTMTSTARRRLSEGLPESVAVAVWEFMQGPLAQVPRRVGKQLTAPYEGVWSARRGTYRVLYRVDEETRTVRVVDVSHRRDAYRGAR